MGFEAQMQAQRQTAIRRRGVVNTALGHYAQAEADLRASYELALKLFGPKHGRTAIIRQSLGWHYVSAGDPKRGLAELTAVSELVREIFGEVSQAYGSSLHNRGNAYMALKQEDLALASFQKSAAEILRLQNKLTQAQSAFAEVEQAWSTVMAPGAPTRGPLYFGQAQVAYQLAQGTQASEYIQRSITVFRGAQGSARDLAHALALQGRILAQQARQKEAAGAFQEAIELLQAQTPPDLKSTRAWQIECAELTATP